MRSSRPSLAGNRARVEDQGTGLLRQLLHQATTGHQLNELNSESLMTRVFTHRYAQLDSRKNGLQDFVTEAAQKHTAQHAELGAPLVHYMQCLLKRETYAKENAGQHVEISWEPDAKGHVFPRGTFSCTVFEGDPISIWHNYENPDALRTVEEADDVGDMTAAMFGADPTAAADLGATVGGDGDGDGGEEGNDGAEDGDDSPATTAQGEAAAGAPE